MHELSICQALLSEAEAIAARHEARRILSISVRIGPLSGVDAGLLARAFAVARADTVAADATLQIEASVVHVKCNTCGAVSTAQPTKLLCGLCQDHRVRLIEGDELLLSSLELETEDNAHSKTKGESPCVTSN